MKEREMSFPNEIHDLIIESFLHLVKTIQGNPSRLIIPKKRKDVELRISEQELKYLFIQSFLISNFFREWTYSIETPTSQTYILTKDRKPHPFELNPSEGGRSANVDLCLYKDNELFAMFEFKANNPGYFEHGKDLYKLTHEPCPLKYFIEVYTKTSRNTIKNIEEKLNKNKYCSISPCIHFYGLSIEHVDTEGPVVLTYDHNLKKIIYSSI